METTNEDSKSVITKAQAKKSPPGPKSAMKKLDPAAAKLLGQLKEKANKKDFGRKVLEREILGQALKLVTEEHLKELQAQTYTEKDRLSMAHEEYQKANGKITLDQFIGKLLSGEYQSKPKSI